jgi:pilus assembly protein CpaB
MEAHGRLGRLGSGRSGRTLASRRNSILIAAASAVLAGCLIYLFVSHDRKPTTTVLAPTETTIFEARGYIAAGTADSVVAKQGLLKPVQIPVSQALAGAITDPSVVSGEVVAAPIAAGQQITGSDFSHANPTIASYLSGDERAVGFAFDAPHGLTSYVRQGDTVDVMAQGTKGTALVAQNITVLANRGGDVVLRLTDKQSLQLATVSGVSTLWLILRPVTGAADSIKVGTLEKL